MTSHVIAFVMRWRHPGAMTAYALAHLRTPQINDEVLEYIERIQGTMDPYGGRFLVHGATVEVREGDWPGTVVILEFPDVDTARAWYESPAYQQILPLRTAHIDGDTIIVDGVAPAYSAAHTAAVLTGRARPRRRPDVGHQREDRPCPGPSQSNSRRPSSPFASACSYPCPSTPT